MSASSLRRWARIVADLTCLVLVLAVAAEARASEVTYNIVDYPVNEADTISGGIDTISRDDRHQRDHRPHYRREYHWRDLLVHQFEGQCERAGVVLFPRRIRSDGDRSAPGSRDPL